MELNSYSRQPYNQNLLKHSKSSKSPLLKLTLFSNFLTIFVILFKTANADTNLDEHINKQCNTNLGFNPNTLSCSTCDDMKNFKLSEQIISNCNSCCKSTSNTEEIHKYIKAELLVCNWKLGHFPQVSDFIKNDSKKYTNLKVKYVRGSPPVIKLYEAGDIESSTIAIGAWSDSALREYFEEKLEN